MAVRISEADYRRMTGEAPPPGRPAGKAAVPPRPVDPSLHRPGSSWTVRVPDWHPATVNQLMHSVGARVRLKKRDRKVVGDYFLWASVPPAHGRRRVHLTVVLGPGQRSTDVDANHKALLDALKHHGLIRNDSPRWCEITPVVYERARRPASVVTLEDI